MEDKAPKKTHINTESQGFPAINSSSFHLLLKAKNYHIISWKSIILGMTVSCTIVEIQKYNVIWLIKKKKEKKKNSTKPPQHYQSLC